MATYVFSYRSPGTYRPTPESTAAWQAWFGEMGDQVADLGKPVVARAEVGNCSSASTVLAGYSLIDADDLEGALVLAKGCPLVGREGGVEIGLLGEVPTAS